ncbi:hypothetical protein OCU04_008050 [Sclerotinia nivalis]|uniref:Uncharacterized protein n=1 Tax=Sclerotinia nivalis TaxID=352851 RepID=A0A9X0DJ95_9HELO|nr:hypothetical protein OCU04_008050 [Sclerotinia nivalis]
MDYAPIALQATDVLVDKHFHRIPDKAFRKETYKPRVPFKNSRRRRREEEERRNSRDQGQYQDERRNSRDSRNQEDRDSGVQRQEEPYKDPEIEEAGYDSEPDYTSQQRERNMRDRDWGSRERDRDLRDIPRHSGAGIGGGTAYGYGNSYEESNHSNTPPQQIYSQQPPRLRPEYLPKYVAPSQLGSDNPYPYYFPPPHIEPSSDSFGREGRERDYDSDERYDRESTRRPKPMQRRSSYDDIHNQRNASSNSEQRLTTRDTERKPRSSHSSQAPNKSKESHMENIKDRADRYGVKNEVKGIFTDSPKGLAGGAIGALVGGWAAEKLQEAQTGRDRKDMGDRAKIYTLLGAGAGGLVVNAVVDRWEDGKEETRVRQRRWEEKFPEGKRERGERERSEKGERERERDGRSEGGRRDSVRSRRDRDRDGDRDDSW